jgi:hypothetical protein
MASRQELLYAAATINVAFFMELASTVELQYKHNSRY